jgi:integrase
MATITRRTWTTPSGATRTAWLLTYVDSKGTRRRRNFERKRDAETERIRVEGEIAEGVHVADRASITVVDAAKAFLKDFEALVEDGKRERTTLEMYDQHVRLHLAPFAVAGIKLSRLTGPDCAEYGTELEASRSDAMARRVFTTLRTILKFAIRNGWTKVNVARDVTIRVAGARIAASGDDPGGVYFPTLTEVRALLSAAEARAKVDHHRSLALLHVMLYAGLRASEVRGLRRRDVDLKRRSVRVAQRADRRCKIGPLKSAAAAREVPISGATCRVLRRWMIAAPTSSKDLIFPNGAGNAESNTNLRRRWWLDLMLEAELAEKITDGATTRVVPKFGFHALRHAAVSLWIAQEATRKQVQVWVGHEDIRFTLNRYGHLWPEDTSAASVTEGVQRLIARGK